jgi:hypothetical protein
MLDGLQHQELMQIIVVSQQYLPHYRAYLQAKNIPTGTLPIGLSVMTTLKRQIFYVILSDRVEKGIVSGGIMQ